MKPTCHYHPVTQALARCPDCSRHFCAACLDATTERTDTVPCPQCGATLITAEPELGLRPPANLRGVSVAFVHERTVLVWLLTLAASWVLVAGGALSAALGAQCAALLAGGVAGLTYIKHKERQTRPHWRQAAATAVACACMTWLLWVLNTTLGPWAMSGGALLLGPLLALFVLYRRLPPELVTGQTLDALRATLAALQNDAQQPFLMATGLLLVWSLLSDVLLQSLPTTVAIIGALAVISAMLCGFALWLDQLLFAHGLEAGVRTRQNFAPRRAQAPSPQRIMDAQLDMALRDGDFAAAKTLLAAAVQRGDRGTRALQWYQLLIDTRDTITLVESAPTLLHVLLQHQRGDEALALLSRCRQHNPAFRLYDAITVRELARLCHQREQYKTLLWLTAEAHTRFDDAGIVAELYWLAAHTLATQFKQQEKAAAYLRHIVNSEVSSAMRARAETRLREIAHLRTPRDAKH